MTFALIWANIWSETRTGRQPDRIRKNEVRKMLHFVEADVRKEGNVITVNMDGYTDRKTVLGAVHEIGREVAKYDQGEGELLLSAKTAAEAKGLQVLPSAYPTAEDRNNGYIFELEEVSCATLYDEETDTCKYENGTYYFHIRFFITEEDFPELKTAVLSGRSYDSKRDCQKLAEAAKAADVEAVSIDITWKRSQMWGYNPTATATVFYKGGGWSEHVGRASGCGHDKESAAVADALDRCPAVLKALYSTKEKAIANGWKYSGQLNRQSESNATCIAYGAGYGTLPYFEGGVGMNSLTDVFKACGFVLRAKKQSRQRGYYNFQRVEA